jgi:hypothetical protein
MSELESGSDYEYNIRVSQFGGERMLYSEWSSEQALLDLWGVDDLTEIPGGMTVVKRLKPGEATEAENRAAGYRVDQMLLGFYDDDDED